MKQPPLWQVIELDDIQLVRADCHTNWPSDAIPETAPDLRLDIEPKNVFHEASHTLEITVALRLSSFDDAEDTVQFSISADYRIRYKCPVDFQPDDAEVGDFARRNAPFNVWPYWREHFHSMSGRMGVPFPPLPLFRVPAKEDVEEKPKKKGKTAAKKLTKGSPRKPKTKTTTS
jgi:hypothetical protein